MNIEEILQQEPAKIYKILCKDSNPKRTPKEFREEFEGKRSRRPTSVDNRENKTINVYSETKLDENGNPALERTETVESAKYKTSYPQRIVYTSVAFLFGGDMTVSFDEDSESSEHFKKLLTKKLKLQSVLSEFAETVEIETKSALLFYPYPKNEAGKEVLQPRVKILNSANSEFYPHFNEYGDMDAFVRKYKALYAQDLKEHNFMWIQTSDKEYLYLDLDGSWKIVEKYPKPNLAGKITVVYAEQKQPEWEGVTTPLDYFENRASRLIDTNDYFSEPILKTFGESSLPSKSTAGKEISFPMEVDDDGKKQHGDAEYLTWMQSIDSIAKELELEENEILGGSFTPNFFMEKLSGLGNVAENTMQLMFMDAFIKRRRKMRIFGPAIERCISVLVALVGNVTNTTMKISLETANPTVEFGSILPNNLSDLIDTLRKANGDKPINAQETITALSPFTKDTIEEVQRLKKEASEDVKNTSLTGITLE